MQKALPLGLLAALVMAPLAAGQSTPAAARSAPAAAATTTEGGAGATTAGAPLGHSEEPVHTDTEAIAELEALLAQMSGEASPATSAPPPPEVVDTLDQAQAVFAASGFAPLVARGEETVHPFGRGPVGVRCLPTRVCDLRLEAGESIDGHAIGDPVSWETTVLYEGPAAAPIPHFLLKPSLFNLRTNLVITTDRRAYAVELDVPSERDARADDGRFDRRVAWWYPEAWAERRAAERERRQAADHEREAVQVAAHDPAAMHWGYEVEVPWRRSRRLGWEPIAVYDDGRRTFVRLPAGAAVPAVFRAEGDELAPLATPPPRDGWLIVPTVADELVLVRGAGRDKRSLRLVRVDHGR